MKPKRMQRIPRRQRLVAPSRVPPSDPIPRHPGILCRVSHFDVPMYDWVDVNGQYAAEQEMAGPIWRAGLAAKKCTRKL